MSQRSSSRRARRWDPRTGDRPRARSRRAGGGRPRNLVLTRGKKPPHCLTTQDALRGRHPPFTAARIRWSVAAARAGGGLPGQRQDRPHLPVAARRAQGVRCGRSRKGRPAETRVPGANCDSELEPESDSFQSQNPTRILFRHGGDPHPRPPRGAASLPLSRPHGTALARGTPVSSRPFSSFPCPAQARTRSISLKSDTGPRIRPSGNRRKLRCRARGHRPSGK